MKGKIFKTGDANKKRIVAIFYTILAFIVAGLSLGLYFVFKDNSKANGTAQISDANVQTVGYSEQQKEDINNSVAELLGLDEIDDEEKAGFNERELLQYNIKLGVANAAADVFAESNVPATSIDAIVNYLADNKIEESSILDAFTYTPGSQDILNIDVVDFLDIGTEYFNYVQNLRKFVNKGSKEQDPLMTDDQVIDVIMGLINVALDTRNANDEEFKDENNEDLATYIDELAEVKLAWNEKYGGYTGNYYIKTLAQSIKGDYDAWKFYTGEDRYAEFLSKNGLSDKADLRAEWDNLVADIKALSDAENNLIRASLYATQNYLFNKAEEGFNEEESNVKKLTKFGIKLEKAVLKMTSFLNTTQLKKLLIGIYNGETSEGDLIEFFNSNANAMRKAVADTNGQVITVSEELYNTLYDIQYDIDDVYAALYVMCKVSDGTTVQQICNLLGVAKDAIAILIEGIEDVEKIVNGAYDGVTGLMATLGKTDGPTTVVYNIVDAFLNDIAYNRGIESKIIEEEEIEFTGTEFIDVLTGSGQIPLALIEIVDGIFGNLGADLTRSEINRAVELVFYGMGTVNGIMSASSSGFNFMQYFYDIKDEIINVNENCQEEIEMYTGIVKSVLDVLEDVIEFKDFLSTRDPNDESTKGLTAAQKVLVDKGIRLNYNYVKLGDILSAILLSDSKLTIKIEDLELPGIGEIDIDIKDQTFFDALVTILDEMDLEIGNDITIKLTKVDNAGIKVSIGSIEVLVKKSDVTAIGDIVSGLVSLLSKTISPYYDKIMDIVADGIDVDMTNKQEYIKGGLNVLFNEENPDMLSFSDYVINYYKGDDTLLGWFLLLSYLVIT